MRVCMCMTAYGGMLVYEWVHVSSYPWFSHSVWIFYRNTPVPAEVLSPGLSTAGLLDRAAERGLR